MNHQQQPTTSNAEQPAQAPVAAPQQRAILDQALDKISAMKREGTLNLPASYSAENALRSAWLLIQQTENLSKQPALAVCTPISIANALVKMVLQGLNPDKKQCYFIVYGNRLEMQRSYFGSIAIAKRVAGVKECIGVPIYEGDIFKYQLDIATGKKKVTQHDQDFDNISPDKLKGAYAVVQYEDGRVEYDVMTMAQIRTSWEQGATKGQSPAHKKFPDQMACKTVIGRALKVDINSSGDEDLFAGEPSTVPMQAKADADMEIEQNGNQGEVIGFTDIPDSAQEGPQEAPEEETHESSEGSVTGDLFDNGKQF